MASVRATFSISDVLNMVTDQNNEDSSDDNSCSSTIDNASDMPWDADVSDRSSGKYSPLNIRKEVSPICNKLCAIAIYNWIKL